MEAENLKAFFALSSEMTGYPVIELVATGVGEEYYAKLLEVVGHENTFDLLRFADLIIKEDMEASERTVAFRKRMWLDPRFGPVLRSVVKMWYLGNWMPLPASWFSAYSSASEPPRENRPHVISARAYKEGLVWRALGTHPPAAKYPGYDSWSAAPEPSTRAL
jgi:hypothetical protein